MKNVQAFMYNRYEKFKRFYFKWRILLWKAVLMRLHSPVITALEIAVPIVLSLQIRLIFEPLALNIQDLDRYTKNELLNSFPDDADCWYVPRNPFVDELMSRASVKLRTKIQPADNEINLVLSHYSKNKSSKSLWAIFEIDRNISAKPKVLEYKIRSSEIGESRMIMMHEEEPLDEDPYVSTGFIAFQIAIEDSFIEMWKNSALPKVGEELTIARFPFYKVDFVIIPSIVRPNITIIYYMMVVAFLLLPIGTLQKVMHDKQTGFRGLMRLMNMPFSVLYIGWLSYLMITVIPVTIACTILLYPVFSNSNSLVTAIFIIMYNILSMLFMFAVGTFFNRSMKALLTSLCSWLFLTHFTIVLDQFLVTASLTWKIVSLILPHSGLLYGLVAFTSHDYLEGYQSDKLKNVLQSKPNMYENPTSHFWPRRLSELLTLRDAYDIMHMKEKIPIGIVLTSWSFHIVFWYLLTIYLDNINPGQFGSTKPWYYLCKKNHHEDLSGDVTLRGSTNWSAVEQTPSFIKPSIRAKCVTKQFGRLRDRVTAVNEMTIDFYQQEFNIILGHNGSGKSTLLKLIVGMYKPTSGQVYLEGRDFNLSEGEVNPVGYCAQENILVNYLTTIEHLYLFGMMKGMSFKDAYAQALSLIKELDLESAKDSKMNNCSFGTQRRVCLATALIGNSQILILDEPTHGIDPEHRRRIWNLLSEIKHNKTILMATNSMEAADILPDRIAIIANGRIECYGSKMYLNRRYGIGYVLSLLVHDNFDLERLRTEIQEFSSEPITLRGTMGLVIRFDVPRNCRFTRLLRHLESNKDDLNIVSVALGAASIEGQFLRIGLASQFKERGVYYRRSRYELIVQQRRRHLLQYAKPWKRLSGIALWRQQVLAMFYKKFLHISASWKLYLFFTSLAIITLLLTTMISELSSFQLFEMTERVMNLTNYIDDYNLHVLYYAADSKSARNFLLVLYTVGQLYSEKRNYHISENITAAELMIHPDLHSIEFRDRYIISIDIHADDHVELMYSSTAVHSGPTAVNLFHNALLRYHSGLNDCWIKLISRPLMNPKQWQHLLIHPRSIRNWENAAIITTLFLILPTLDLGARELTTVSKTLQLNTLGVSTLMYWVPMYIVDLMIYSLSVALLTVLIYIIYHGVIWFPALDIVQVLITFICYGACVIPFGYCIQLFATKMENVYLIIIVINFTIVLLVNGSLVLPLVFRLFTGTGRYFFEMILHTLPPYIFACAISNYIMLNIYNRQCSYFNTCDTEFRVEDPCCQNCGETGCYKPLNIMLIKQSGAEYHHSIIDDLLLMISMSLGFHLLLQFLETKNRRKWNGFFVSSKRNKDITETESEVIQEKKQVEAHIKHYENTRSLPQHVALVVHNLRKNYKNRLAVRGVTFDIHRQECFGLLGFNGAGKSTIFKMLTGQTKMSGRAIMYNHEFMKNQDMFIGYVGYCPQAGGLNDFMTGRQYLQLHAALRGVPYKNIAAEVDKWLDTLDLLDFENLKIEHCPAGIQRKICILQSLIADLPMVFMDEPSSGIDLMASRAMCDTLHQAREMGRTLLITTHNMREAEAICSRVGILVNGQFVAIGSCEQLKKKHGNNFILSIKVTPEFHLKHIENVKKIIDETFPGITFKDRHLGILKYELEGDIPYSNIFDRLEKLRQQYPWITDFSVTQPSMDQVFLELAKGQRETPTKLRLYKKLWLHAIELVRKI